MGEENTHAFKPAHHAKKLFLGSVELEVFDSVYEPREDSFLLASTLRTHEGARALDMGCGCGIQAVNMAMQGAKVTAVDINQRAVENTKENAKRLGLSDRISAKKSDLFSALKRKRFDVIAFNPPYLPNQGKADVALDGGTNGQELTHKFLDSLSFHLKKGRECFVVASSLNGFSALPQKATELAFSCKCVARKRLFFEEIRVFRLR